jgi:uncharacterized protein
MDLTLVLTHACNLGCTYCYAGRKFGKSMPIETAHAAIDWACGSLEPGAQLRTAYFGGEPLMAYELLQTAHVYAVRRAAERGLVHTSSVTTNGTALTAEKMDWLDAHNVVVGISIDGVQAAHDTTRPTPTGKSTFDDVRRGLQVALARAPLTETISVVDPATVHLMADSARFLVAEGVRVMSFSLNYTADWTESDLALYEAQLGEVGELMMASYRRGSDIYVQSLDGKIIGQLRADRGKCGGCTFGIGEVAVAPSGRLYPCERLVGEDEDEQHVIGHVSTGVDRARVAALLGHGKGPEPECLACPLFDRCMNTCGCSNIFSSGDAAVPGAALCLTEQIHARVADRVARTLFWEGNPRFLWKYYGEKRQAKVG